MEITAIYNDILKTAKLSLAAFTPLVPGSVQERIMGRETAANCTFFSGIMEIAVAQYVSDSVPFEHLKLPVFLYLAGDGIVRNFSGLEETPAGTVLLECAYRVIKSVAGFVAPYLEYFEYHAEPPDEYALMKNP